MLFRKKSALLGWTAFEFLPVFMEFWHSIIRWSELFYTAVYHLSWICRFLPLLYAHIGVPTVIWPCHQNISVSKEHTQNGNHTAAYPLLTCEEITSDLYRPMLRKISCLLPVDADFFLEQF